MAELVINQVEKYFDTTPALSGIDARINDGEFVALLGPSGCGKTTLLRLLAGFEQPSKGSLAIGGNKVACTQTGLFTPPEDRNIGIVFQSYALWPHMSVTRNIAYPLEVRGVPRALREQKVRAALALTELEPYAKRAPSALSGGQRQRVALARCLVTDPAAVLLDEPMANLDLALRATMQEAFANFHQRTGATMVHVTHDQTEAMAMADRVAVMKAGRIRQFAAPEILYNEPEDAFVASFVGEGTILHATPTDKLNCNSINMDVLGQRVVARSRSDAPNQVCIRPEHLAFKDDAQLRAKIKSTTYLGGKFRLKLETLCGNILVAFSQYRLQSEMAVGLEITNPWAFFDKGARNG